VLVGQHFKEEMKAHTRKAARILTAGGWELIDMGRKTKHERDKSTKKYTE
jgi:hypothetical protein